MNYCLNIISRGEYHELQNNELNMENNAHKLKNFIQKQAAMFTRQHSKAYQWHWHHKRSFVLDTRREKEAGETQNNLEEGLRQRSWHHFICLGVRGAKGGTESSSIGEAVEALCIAWHTKTHNHDDDNDISKGILKCYSVRSQVSCPIRMLDSNIHLWKLIC